ncbi:hypothetical protein JOM56_011009 [Amanita muscaria]
MDIIGCLVCHPSTPQALPHEAEISARIDGKIVRSGVLRVKKEGGLFSGWRTKWVVLQDETLTVYSSQASRRTKEAVIYLRDVQNIERVDQGPYCLVLETNNPTRRYLLSLRNDVELYDWQDDVYLRTPRGEGSPFDFKHDVHVGVDPRTGEFTTAAGGRSPTGFMDALGTTLGTLSRR